MTDDERDMLLAILWGVWITVGLVAAICIHFKIFSVNKNERT
jgi:hypothetical protein